MGEASVKIPEGKLVKVKTEDGKVKVTGDFFLQPPQALSVIQEKLSELDEKTQEAAEKTLEGIEADFIGFSPVHIAEAYAEALKQDEDNSKSPEWRIVNEGSYSEAMHHAIDEVLTEKMESGNLEPTLRFWYRENPSVPFGRFQSLEDEVEVDYAEENDVELVRRITGGGAMYVEPGNVITYSLYLPKEKVSEDIEESYEQLDRFAVEALKELGVEASYEPLNDIEHEKGKLGGAAQLRKEETILHHTTISYDLDTEEMLRVLRIGKEKISDKAVKSAEKRVSRISDHIDHPRQKVIQKFIEKFRQNHSAEKDSLTDEELEKARQLAEEKFSTREWNQKL